MRPILRTAAVAAVLAIGLAGCSSSSSSPSASASPAPSGWQTPKDVLEGVKAAGFNCTLPSTDPQPQVLTKDPFTGKDLGGHALVRCPDFQIMLASGSVDDGFATLVTCQAVPQTIRDSKEWVVPVVEGSNFLILPANLTTGWAATAQPKDFVTKVGGKESTFGAVYDRACAGRMVAPTGGGSAAPDQSTAPSASAAPSAS
ncbi:MAG: hypothetical protein WCP95_07030 [Actinomycetes bacterium]